MGIINQRLPHKCKLEYSLVVTIARTNQPIINTQPYHMDLLLYRNIQQIYMCSVSTSNVKGKRLPGHEVVGENLAQQAPDIGRSSPDLRTLKRLERKYLRTTKERA